MCAGCAVSAVRTGHRAGTGPTANAARIAAGQQHRRDRKQITGNPILAGRRCKRRHAPPAHALRVRAPADCAASGPCDNAADHRRPVAARLGRASQRGAPLRRLLRRVPDGRIRVRHGVAPLLQSRSRRTARKRRGCAVRHSFRLTPPRLPSKTQGRCVYLSCKHDRPSARGGCQAESREPRLTATTAGASIVRFARYAPTQGPHHEHAHPR